METSARLAKADEKAIGLLSLRKLTAEWTRLGGFSLAARMQQLAAIESVIDVSEKESKT